MSTKHTSTGLRNKLFHALNARASELAYMSDAFEALTDADDILCDAQERLVAARKRVDGVDADALSMRQAARTTFKEFCFVWAIHRRRPSRDTPAEFLTVPSHFDRCSNEQLFKALLPDLGTILAQKDLRPIERMAANQLFVELQNLRRVAPRRIEAQAQLNMARASVDAATRTWDECLLALSETLDLETFFEWGSPEEQVLEHFLDVGVLDRPIHRPPSRLELRRAA